MIGHVRTARYTGLNISSYLSHLKKHTHSLSLYGDYNVASCIPTRSTFGEYITFQGEKSMKKKFLTQLLCDNCDAIIDNRIIYHVKIIIKSCKIVYNLSVLIKTKVVF